MMKPVEGWVQQLDIVFIANRTQLHRAAYKILGDWERAEDVVQDTYVKITELSLNAQTVKRPLAYLFQIVRNLAIDHYRRTAFETELFGTEEEGLLVPVLAGAPERSAINRQDLERIVKALSQLPERTKRVFELYRIEGYTHRMIADELKISTSLTNILIHQAIEHCKNILMESMAD
jgi:RNA polymerase sigma-70 factor (ECF subfamily)